jgi:acyl carrier protein phosphodiesterase
MNYLAHLFLSGHTPEALIGGLLGDFVKGAIGNRYDVRVCKGISLHRKIDRYTDDHEVVVASRRLMSRERRRFAGIMVDVFYDHFLACHWSRYAVVSLDEFTRQVYPILLQHHHHFPQRLQYIVPRMVRDDWLGSYRELWRVGAALDGISRRLRRSNTLAGGLRELEANYVRFEQHFLAFFPQLMRHVGRCKADAGIYEASVWRRPFSADHNTGCGDARSSW